MTEGEIDEMVGAPPLSGCIEQAFQAGIRAWGDMGLALHDFRATLLSKALDAPRLRDHGSELYLAASCALGLPKGIAVFEKTFLVGLPRALGRYCLPASTLDELGQQLRIRLLVGPPPRIVLYTGHGPLGAFVRVCAVRLALEFQRSHSSPAESDDSALDTLICKGVGPDVLAIKANYGLAFQSALEETIANLTDREKTLLRMHCVDGLGIDSIGRVFRAHRSTVARWLVAIRTRSLEGVMQRLSATLGGSDDELRSLVNALVTDIHLSMGRLLSAEPGAQLESCREPGHSAQVCAQNRHAEDL